MAKRSKSKMSDKAKKVAQNTKKRKEQGAQFGHLNLPRNVSVFKPEPKRSVRFDFLEYTVSDPKHSDRDDELGIAVPGSLWYKRPYLLLRNIGANGEAVVSPRTIGKPCPVSEYRQRRLAQGESWQSEELKALRPKARSLYAVIPLDDRDHDEKIHIWDVSDFLFQQKLDDELEEDESNALFSDLDEGMTLKVRFAEGNFAGRTYAETSRIDFEERDEQYGADYASEVPDLDKVIKIPTYKELEAKFFDVEDEVEPEDEPEEEEEPPPKRRKTAKRPSTDYDEDVPMNPGSDDEDDEEEEPEEKPAPRRRKRAEPEPEEEDDDEEEPEEPPKRRRRRGA